MCCLCSSWTSHSMKLWAHCVQTKLYNQSVKLRNDNKPWIKFYLPVCQENNRFDDVKLWNWIERLKQIFACHIKQCQSIQCQSIGDCVYNGEIQIWLFRTEIFIHVFPFCIKYECNSNLEGLQNHKLQTTLLAPSNKMAALNQNSNSDRN
jgi:hypothetical protein